MFAKIFLVVCFATLAVSFPKDDHENELLNTVLGSATNIGKEFSRLVSDDTDKYSVDFNSLYKKYEIASKADEAKQYVKTQFKQVAEFVNDAIKKGDIESEESLKKNIEIIKREDSVLAEKLNKFYEKTCEIDRITEDILKYILDADKVSTVLEKVKNSLHPLEHKVVEAIKKIETLIVEHSPKKSKNKN